MVDEVRGQRGDTLRQAGLLHLLYGIGTCRTIS
jgi:hypothetical protein